MPKSFLELIVGSLDEKRAYRQLMKRVNALPKDYRFAYKKIQHYMYYFEASGCDMDMLTDLLDLFEASACEGKAVLDVLGSDVATFCDELIRATTQHGATTREKLNEDILNHFYGKGNDHEHHQKNS